MTSPCRFRVNEYKCVFYSHLVCYFIFSARLRGGGDDRAGPLLTLKHLLSSELSCWSLAFRSGGSGGLWPTLRPCEPKLLWAPYVPRSRRPCRRAPHPNAGCSGTWGQWLRWLSPSIIGDTAQPQTLQVKPVFCCLSKFRLSFEVSFLSPDFFA